MGWDGVRVWVVPSSVGPRAAVGPGPRPGLAAATRRPLPACPSPLSRPFKTSRSLGPFCCRKPPSCSGQHLLLLRCCPAQQPMSRPVVLMERWLSPRCVPIHPRAGRWCQAAELRWFSRSRNSHGPPDLSCYQKGEREAGAQSKRNRNDQPLAFLAAKLSARTGD